MPASMQRTEPPAISIVGTDKLEASDRVLNAIRLIDGIATTETSILLSTYKVRLKTLLVSLNRKTKPPVMVLQKFKVWFETFWQLDGLPIKFQQRTHHKAIGS